MRPTITIEQFMDAVKSIEHKCPDNVQEELDLVVFYMDQQSREQGVLLTALTEATEELSYHVDNVNCEVKVSDGVFKECKEILARRGVVINEQ